MAEQKIRVLIVDDDAEQREALTELLSGREGMKAVTASSGTEALGKLRKAKRSYDIVVTDQNLMGQMDGITLTKTIKKEFPSIEVIIFSGISQYDGLEALQAGAFRYITKPFKPEELIGIIKSALGEQRLEREVYGKLGDIIKALSKKQVDEPQDVLRDIVEIACSLVGADSAVLYPYDPYRNDYYDEKHVIRINVEEYAVSDKPRKYGMAQRVRESGLVVVESINDLEENLRGKFLSREGIVSFVGVSLRTAKSVTEGEFGVLYLNYRQPHKFTRDELDAIQIFADLAARQYELVYVRALAREQSVLVEASKLIGEQKLANDVLRIAFRQAFDLVGRTTGLVLSVESRIDSESCNRFKILDVEGVSEEQIKVFHARPAEASFGSFDKVVETGEIFKCEDAKEELESGQVVDVGLPVPNQVINIPVKRNQEVVGILVLDIIPNQRVEESLLALADIAQIALERIHSQEQNVRELEALRRRESLTEGLESLYQIAVLEDLDEVLEKAVEIVNDVLGKSSTCNIALYDESQGFYRNHAAGPHKNLVDELPRPEPSGTGRYVLEKKESLYLDDVTHPPDGKPTVRDATRSWVRSFAAIPLLRQQNIVGVMFINLDEPFSFSQDIRKVLEVAAKQAALAIENVTLYSETRSLRKFNEEIVVGMGEGILIEDAEGIITYANPSIEQLLGYEQGELLDKHYTFVVAETLRSYTQERTGERKLGKPGKYEVDFTTKAGEVIPVIVSARPILDEEGKFSGVLSVITDVKSLREAEGRAKEIVTGVAVPIFAIDNDKRVVYWNDACAQLTGHKSEDMIGTTHQWKPFYLKPRSVMADLIVEGLDEDKMMARYGDKILPKREGLPEGTFEVEDQFDTLGGKWLYFTASPLRDTAGNIIGAIETLQDITERKRAEQALQQQADGLVRLQKSTAQISAHSSKFDEVVQLILDNLVEMFPDSNCAIRLYDAATNSFGVRMGSGTLQDHLEFEPREGGTSWYVIEKRQPLFVSDSSILPEEKNLTIRREFADLNIKSLAYLPLQVGTDAPVGILYLNLTYAHDFTDNEKQLLTLFASQAAIAIQNAHLFEKTEQQAERLVKLQEITAAITAEPEDHQKVLRAIVDRVESIFPETVCDIRLYNSITGEFTERVVAESLEKTDYRPRKTGVSEYVIEKKQPFYAESVEKLLPSGEPAIRDEIQASGVRAMATLPLLSKNEVIGVLYLDWFKPHSFPSQDKQILELFGNQAAIAIENARVSEQQREYLAALQEISDAVTEKNLRVILGLITQKAVDVIPGEYGELWLFDPETGDLTLESAVGPAAQKAYKIGRIAAGEGSTNFRVAQSGDCEINDDLKPGSITGFLRIYDAARSSVTVPLKYHEEVVGTLNVESAKPNAFTEAHANYLDSLADQAAIAIVTARLVEQQLEDIALLQEVNSAITTADLQEIWNLIAEKAANRARAEYCALWTVEGDQLIFRAVGGNLPDEKRKIPDLLINETSMNGYVAKHGKTYVCYDVNNDPYYFAWLDNIQSSIAIPLKIGQRVIGTLGIESTSPQAFSEHLIKMLESLADQATVAITNAELYQKALKQERTQTLGDLGGALADLEIEI